MNLYIYTVKYPSHGEFFINYELPKASLLFDNVFIVSTKNCNVAQGDFDLLKRKFLNVHYLGCANWTSKVNFSLFSLAEIHGECKKIIGVRGFLKCIYRVYKSLKLNSYIRAIDDLNAFHYSYWGNASALALCDPSIKRKLCRFHGSDLYNNNPKTGYNYFQRKIVSELYTFCISNHGAMYLQRLHGDHVKGITVSYLGVPSRINSMELQPRKFNDLYAVKVVSLIIIASLDHNKRVLEILVALSKVSSVRPKVTVVGDGPEFSKIQNFVSGIDLKVDLHGAVEHRVVKDMLSKNNYDFIVNFSKSEGIPVSLMEAMSFGVVPIAPLVGGIGELVCEKTGFLVNPSSDSAQLAEQFHDIFASEPELLASKSKGSIDLVSKRFNLSHNIDAFFNLMVKRVYE